MVVKIQLRASDCMPCRGENYAAEISGWVVLDRRCSLGMEDFSRSIKIFGEMDVFVGMPKNLFLNF